jgi:copper chaperone CopZ
MNESSINKAFIAKRKVSVPNIHSNQCIDVIHEFLDDLGGIVDVTIDQERKTMRLVYDASQLGFDKIEKQLSLAGYPISSNRWARMKAAMYRFEDENQRNNAHSKGGACCSHPKGIYSKGRK